jgi:hypothetical protein
MPHSAATHQQSTDIQRYSVPRAMPQRRSSCNTLPVVNLQSCLPPTSRLPTNPCQMLFSTIPGSKGTNKSTFQAHDQTA